MGNELTTLVPDQIIPVENYLKDVNFTKSLASTRFLKTALVQDDYGRYCVGKVFVIHSDSLLTDSFKECLSRNEKTLGMLRIYLANMPNCLPYFSSKLQITSDLTTAALVVGATTQALPSVDQQLQYGVIFREYHSTTLLDTSSEFSATEQVWVIFQMLKAVEQAHSTGMVHGDIKCENFLLTAWQWCYLSDFAPFKPIRLPANDPSCFNFYFDSSRRRTCSIAPERFSADTTVLTTQMDIFSLGCCIYEFVANEPLFSLSTLLTYRQTGLLPLERFEKIENIHLRKMVTSMVALDPSARYSASQYLSNYKETLFPDFFTTDLFPTASEKWLKLEKLDDFDLESLFEAVEPDYRDIFGVVVDFIVHAKSIAQMKRLHLLNRLLTTFLPSQFVLRERILPVLVFFISDERHAHSRTFLAQTLRVLALCLSKIQPLNGQDPLTKNMPLLDLIVNLCISLISKKDATALSLRQALAFSIGDIMANICRISPSSVDRYQSNLVTAFKDSDGFFITDPTESVRRIFLKFSLQQVCQNFSVLHRHILEFLFTYLGRENSWNLRRDLLYSFPHIASPIENLKTYLEEALLDMNEKVIEASLRTILALFVTKELTGSSRFTYQKMLFQLSKNAVCLLCHPNKLIVYNTAKLIALTSKELGIVRAKLELRPVLDDFVQRPDISLVDDVETLLFILHAPVVHDMYHKMIHLSTSQRNELFSTLGGANTKAKELYKIRVDDEILNKRLVSMQQLINITGTLSVGTTRHRILEQFESFSSFEHSNATLTRHLNSGTKLLRFDLKQDKSDSKSISHTVVFSGRSPDASYHKHLKSKEWEEMFGQESGVANNRTRTGSNSLRSLSNHRIQGQTDMNYDQTRQTRETAEHRATARDNLFASSRVRHLAKSKAGSGASDAGEKSEKHHMASRKDRLNELLRRRKINFRKTIEADVDDATDMAFSNRGPGSGWKPRGRLLGQVSAIDSCYDQFRLKSGSSEEWYCGDVHLAVSPNHSKFASAAGDGSLKIWRPLDFLQKILVHRPILSDKLGCAITKLEFTSEESLLVVTVDGRMLIYRIRESGSLVVDSIKTVDPSSSGRIIDFCTIKSSKPCECIFGTSHRTVAHWDTRVRNDLSWSFKTKIEEGLLSCLALPNSGFSQTHWMAYATQRGTHVIWDLRFQLAANSFQHPMSRGTVDMKLVSSGGPSVANNRNLGFYNRYEVNLETAPVENWHKYLATASEGLNEMNWWNIENGELIATLSANPETLETVHDQPDLPGITSCAFFGKSERSLITAGSDRIVRFWDLDEPTTGSFTVCDAPNYDAGSNSRQNILFLPQKVKQYNATVIENIRHIQEIRQGSDRFHGNCDGTGPMGRIVPGDQILSPKSYRADDKALCSPLPHVDAVSDVCVINCNTQTLGTQALASDYENDKAPNAFVTPMSTSENFMITASRDGFVSVWK